MTASIWTQIDRCRACSKTDLQKVLKYGVTPLADRLVDADEARLIQLGRSVEPEAPLTLARCKACTLVQILETVDPQVLFHNEYPYFSSVSSSLRAHFKNAAKHYTQRFDVSSNDFVLEIASNDGALLKHFVNQGIPALGIDPSAPPAAYANEQGVETWCEFFGTDLVPRILESHGHPKLVIANNVVAHVDDLIGFVSAVRAVLRDDGVFVMECHDLASLISGLQWDTVYHQHLCYFSLTSLQSLLAAHDLVVIDVEEIPTYGGSLRVYASPSGTASTAVSNRLKHETTLGLTGGTVTDEFGHRVQTEVDRLLKFVEHQASSGLRVVAWGAAAKATTLLSLTSISQYLECVVDTNEYKWGRHMPGNHLPIVAPSALYEIQPDAVLLLAWNFADEIAKTIREILGRDVTCIVPIPEVRQMDSVQ